MIHIRITRAALKKSQSLYEFYLKILGGGTSAVSFKLLADSDDSWVGGLVVLPTTECSGQESSSGASLPGVQSCPQISPEFLKFTKHHTPPPLVEQPTESLLRDTGQNPKPALQLTSLWHFSEILNSQSF